VLAFSPNGNLVVLDSEKMQLLESYNGEVIAEYSSSEFPPFPITHIGFSPDGQLLAATDYRGDIGLLDAKTLQVLQHRPETLEMYGPGIAFSPDSHYWATPDYDHTVKVWDVRGGKLALFRTLRGHADSTLCAAFSPDGVLAVGCANGSVRLWDTSTWTERTTLRCHEMAIRAICFSPDGSMLVTGGDDTTVRIHRAPSPEEVNEAEKTGDDPLRAD
jgi:WD40 repeat protein